MYFKTHQKAPPAD